MNIKNKPHVTYAMLESFMAAPGQIDIYIHNLQGHFVPFVFFAPPGQERTGFGPIVYADSLVAGADVQELIDELREKLGTRPNIVQATSNAPPRSAMN